MTTPARDDARAFRTEPAAPTPQLSAPPASTQVPVPPLPSLQDGRHLRVYYLLLQRPGSRVGEVAEALGATAEQAATLIAELRAHQLVGPVGDNEERWESRQPPDSLAPQLEAQEANLAALRAQHQALRRLDEMFWLHRGRQHYDGIEVIYDQVVVLDTLNTLQRQARRQVRCFDRPPFYSIDRPVHRREQHDVEAEQIKAGVPYRVVYESTLWDDPIHAEATLRSLTHGEQARVMPSLPMKLYLIDDLRAVAPLDPAHHSDTATLVIYESGLLRALGEIFETFWQLAAPITPAGQQAAADPLNERERGVLRLLASGANDDLIAQRLALSRSTVTRTIADLQHRLGTVSRFQCGVQATRRGWL